jgi:Flp pilus assembly pilin Flp
MEKSMQRVMAVVGHLLRNEEGQDLLEYVMLVALISIAAVVAVGSVGSTVSDILWQYVANTSI